MASVGLPSDRTTVELLQNLTLDPDNQTALQLQESTKKTFAANYAPAGSGAITNGQSNPLERSALPFHWDSTVPSTSYNPHAHPSSTYYYEDYDVSTINEWDRYGIPDVAEMPHTMYGDYHHGYGYVPYGTYPPSGSNTGRDSQQYAPQQYQYPTTHVQPSSTNNGTHSWNMPNEVQSDVTTSIISSQILLPGETIGNQSHNFSDMIHRPNISKPIRPSYQNASLKSPDTYELANVSAAHHWTSSPGMRSSNFHSGTSQNMQHPPHRMGLQHQMGASGLGVGYMNRMYPNSSLHSQRGNVFRRDVGFRSGSYGARSGSRDWMSPHNMHKSLGRSSVLSSDYSGSVNGLSELNRGPRTKVSKDQDSESIILAVKERTLNNMKGKTVNDEDHLTLFPSREQFNHDDFPETFSNAKFFVIKSYSEDDVHKSVKYGIWASTPNGNKKLDEAYKEAREKPGGCPVFLLFSVNASGQFVGLAEMIGPVDYNKTVEYWQQDKWNGCFPVKWHMVKDVPNNMLRHITLENNENKPVTNSRDTQEVGLVQGIQILKIFKGHSGKTCILDDLEFYEARQKMMQERKAKQVVSSTRQDENVKAAGVAVPTHEVVGERGKGGLSVLDGEAKGREGQRSFAAVLISHDKSHKPPPTTTSSH